MFHKRQMLVFAIFLGLGVTVPLHTLAQKGRVSKTGRAHISSLSDDDYHEYLASESVRILNLWRGWPIAKKERELKKWKESTMPSGLDAIDDDGEDSRKMKWWRAAFVNLQRHARY